MAALLLVNESNLEQLVAGATNWVYESCVRRATLQEVMQFRADAQAFFRAFGLLAGDRTPCGKALGVSHAHALMTLLEQGGMTQRTLAKSLHLDKSTTARLCAKMAEAGHVVQSVGEDDARCRIVALSARGEVLARDVEASSRARFATLLEALPEEGRPQVTDAFRTLVRVLESSAFRPQEQE